MSKNFAVIGVEGDLAPRHLRAIRDTGNRPIAVVDPHSCDVKFFTEIEHFDRHREKLRRGPEENRVHNAHCRLALCVRADALEAVKEFVG